MSENSREEFLNMLPEDMRAKVQEQEAIQDGDFSDFIEAMNKDRGKLTVKMVMSAVTGKTDVTFSTMSELLAHLVLVEERMFKEITAQRDRIATLENLLVGGTESSE